MTRRRRWLALGALALSGAATSYACAIYDGSLLLPGAHDGGTDATMITDTGVPGLVDANDGRAAQDAGQDAGPGCPLLLPPSPPATDTQTGQNLTFVMAFDSLDFGQTDAGLSNIHSYDLDGVCTCPGPESCGPLGAKPVHCDDDGGRDNEGTKALGEVYQLPGLNPNIIDSSLFQGKFGLLVWVGNYNGGANDTSVAVGIYYSYGNDGVQDDSGVATLPLRDGTDHWTVDPNSLENIESNGVDCSVTLCAAKNLVLDAYVANYVLVARPATMQLSLGSKGEGDAGASTITLNLSNGLFTATLSANDAGASYRMTNGVLAGRWAMADLLQQFQFVPDPTMANSFLCPDSVSYQLLKAEACKQADLPSDPQNDGLGTPCNALSMAVGFTASPAQLGIVFAPTPRVSPCGDAAPDLCN